jgi:hypothetical protein
VKGENKVGTENIDNQARGIGYLAEGGAPRLAWAMPIVSARTERDENGNETEVETITYDASGLIAALPEGLEYTLFPTLEDGKRWWTEHRPAKERRSEIMSRFAEIDAERSRALGDIALNVNSEFALAKLREIEAEADDLRAELATL